jgi:hypothetical protein
MQTQNDLQVSCTDLSAAFGYSDRFLLAIQGAFSRCGNCCWGILEKATLTLGDNRRVDLSQTIIFLTSNLGGGEITELMIGGMGLALSVSPESKPHLDEKVEKTGAGAAKRKFAPDRIDKTVVFHPLRSGPARTNPRNRIGNGPAAGAGDGEGTLYVRTIPTNAEGG